MESAQLIQVIKTTERRGSENSKQPCRSITQYWLPTGEFLWEYDPLRNPLSPENCKVILDLRRELEEQHEGILQLRDGITELNHSLDRKDILIESLSAQNDFFRHYLRRMYVRVMGENPPEGPMGWVQDLAARIDEVTYGLPVDQGVVAPGAAPSTGSLGEPEPPVVERRPEDETAQPAGNPEISAPK